MFNSQAIKVDPHSHNYSHIELSNELLLIYIHQDLLHMSHPLF